MPAGVDAVEAVAERLRELLGGRRPCAVALDVDGTLTERRVRGDFLIDLGAVEALRRVERLGVRTLLVTGNSAAVVAGLARYIGSRGPHVAENGCVVYHSGRLYSACTGSARAAARVLEEEMAGVLTPSWQNACRLHDYAFLAPRDRDPGSLVPAVEELLTSRGHRVRVASSGYAIHIRPPDASKGNGLRLALRLAGLDPGCAVAAGDSAMDAEMAGSAAALAAVANADEELKRAAALVLPEPSGRGVRLLLEAVALLASGGE